MARGLNVCLVKKKINHQTTTRLEIANVSLIFLLESCGTFVVCQFDFLTYILITFYAGFSNCLAIIWSILDNGNLVAETYGECGNNKSLLLVY